MANADTVNELNISSSVHDQYISAVYVPFVPKKKVVNWKLCSCVEYAKSLLGHEGEVWGFAGNIKPNSKVPVVGSLILFENHVGVTTVVASDEVTFDESNYERCKKTTRTLKINDKSIKGYKIL